MSARYRAITSMTPRRLAVNAPVCRVLAAASHRRLATGSAGGTACSRHNRAAPAKAPKVALLVTGPGALASIDQIAPA